MQGFGILTAAATTALVTACFQAAYPTPPFPTTIPGGQSWEASTAENKALYAAQIKASVPPEADYVWRIVLALGSVPAAFTLYYRRKMAETPRFTLHVKSDADAMRSDMAEMMVDCRDAAGAEEVLGGPPRPSPHILSLLSETDKDYREGGGLQEGVEEVRERAVGRESEGGGEREERKGPEEEWEGKDEKGERKTIEGEGSAWNVTKGGKEGTSAHQTRSIKTVGSSWEWWCAPCCCAPPCSEAASECAFPCCMLPEALMRCHPLIKTTPPPPPRLTSPTAAAQVGEPESFWPR